MPIKQRTLSFGSESPQKWTQFFKNWEVKQKEQHILELGQKKTSIKLD